jgi:hypothetical protein
MKLSEAIRLGAMLHPQCYGMSMRFATGSDRVIATCALGAAEAAGYSWGLEGNRQMVRCPLDAAVSMSLSAMIAHLNDVHLWTREAIADWVETVEPAEPAPAERRRYGRVRRLQGPCRSRAHRRHQLHRVVQLREPQLHDGAPFRNGQELELFRLFDGGYPVAVGAVVQARLGAVANHVTGGSIHDALRCTRDAAST